MRISDWSSDVCSSDLLGDQYNGFLDCEEVEGAGNPGDVLINRDGKLVRPKRLPSNLYQFRSGTGEDRCVMDCIASLPNGADLLWIETEIGRASCRERVCQYV